MAYFASMVDVAWMQRHVASLRIGGVWGYKDLPIFFKKTGEKTMALTVADESDPVVAEQVHRNRVVMRAAGIIFEDRRAKGGA